MLSSADGGRRTGNRCPSWAACLATVVAAVAAVAGCAPPTVGTASPPAGTSAEPATAVPQYRAYVMAQVGELVPRTQEFVDAVKARNVDQAKALFPLARTGWERIEPIAESFDDLDAKIDAREHDERPAGVAWTGFHRLEKDLWVDGLQTDSPAVADRLAADVGDLQARVGGVELTPEQLTDGAKELLDEVAIIKLSGAEDVYSHTDLWDVSANVEGFEAIVTALRPVIDRKDPTLGPLLDEQFGDMRSVLDSERQGRDFRPFEGQSQYDVAKVSIAVNALSRSANRLDDAVTS